MWHNCRQKLRLSARTNHEQKKDCALRWANRRFGYRHREVHRHAPSESILNSTIALIPAKNESMGVPNKNFRPLAGGSLAERAVRGAVRSSQFDAIYLSTDNETEANRLADLYDIQIKRRSAFACSSDARARDVIDDFLTSPEGSSRGPNPTLVYLQPTSPMRSTKSIIEALTQFATQHRETPIVSVRTLAAEVAKACYLNDSGGLVPFRSDSLSGENRQNLPSCVLPNGAIYIFTENQFNKQNEVPIAGAQPFYMNDVESLDVNLMSDWMQLTEELDA